ncbi:E3 ubiquitin-protein ligase TRIM39-like [Gadus morhua]|uniref:E3 ubiquitin-protein ligase TRIM39-like n=1 Tax=Gadus morhua TaxID=8049 RepID=UPI0011B7233A|nr:E3 ubiquitin-protein ligase TRIM39-like [Gadus morhua]
MASANPSWSEENFSCPICLDSFSSPVTTPCGHNFCRTCITEFWNEQIKYICPLCNMLFNTRPDLWINTLLSELAAQFRTSVRVKEQPFVKPGEVPCDVCTGTQLKAVKSCLVCLISYCQTHLEPHQRVAGLKKHQLVEPMDLLEDRMCKKHNQLLELFCMIEQVCVCQFCTATTHRFHPVVPLKEEYVVKKAQLGKMEAEVHQMIQERKQKIKEIKDTAKRSKEDADSAIADGVQVLTALKRCIEKCQDDLNRMVKERLKSTEKQAEDFIKELEKEIEDLTNRSSEVKQLSHTKDHLHFLKAFKSLKDPPHTRDWMTVEIRPPSYVGTLRRSLDQLEETLNMEMEKLCEDAELKRVQQYEVDVTLDPDTAHPCLTLSEDGKQVHDEDEEKELPDNPKRFTQCVCVLTRQSFSSGRFYFEVQVKDKTKWSFGVARESIDRKDQIIETPETGLWTLYYDNDGLVFNDDPDVCLPLRAELQKVGVFVDYDEGVVSFYDVEARVHIYSATGYTFSEPLYPFLCPCDNPAPLIISPVNIID